MRSSALVMLLMLLVSACSSSETSCRWPADTLPDAGGSGCAATAKFDVCEVDGNGKQTCQNQCTSSQYALTCRNATPSDAHCEVLPLPTPQGQEIYCCPCL